MPLNTVTLININSKHLYYRVLTRYYGISKVKLFNKTLLEFLITFVNL